MRARSQHARKPKIFIYRWGLNPLFRKGSSRVKPEEALEDLQNFARGSYDSNWDVPVGGGAKAPQYSRQASPGDMIVFYAIRSLKRPGVYAVATVANGIKKSNDSPNMWELPIRRLPYSKKLADGHFLGDSKELAPKGQRTTLLGVGQPSPGLRRLVEVATGRETS